jgi:transcriptional repressor NrdR
MRCPDCAKPTKVRKSDTQDDGGVMRRRECLTCGYRFIAEEQVDVSKLPRLQVKKRRSRQTESFDRAKLAQGVQKAYVVKPPPTAELDALVTRVIRNLPKTRPGEALGTAAIGNTVLDALRGVAPETDIARIRYALIFLGQLPPPLGFDHSVRRFLVWMTENYGEDLPMVPPDAQPEQVRKRDGSVQPFDRAKLQKSIEIETKGRSPDPYAAGVTREVADALTGQVLVTSAQIAAEVLRILRRDNRGLAYLRYAAAIKAHSKYTVIDIWREAVPLTDIPSTTRLLGHATALAPVRRQDGNPH